MKIIHDNIRWLVAALLISALPAVAEVRDTLEFDISGSTSESITVDGETFKLYTLPDCDLLDQTGAPMLPVKYIRLSVPYNATDITVTGAGPYTQSVTGDRIYPAPVPIPTDGSVTEAPDMVLDSAIYMTDAYWPPSAAELVGDGFYMGENHIVTVAVYPMVYNPVTSLLRSHSQVRLTVSYTLGDTPGNMLVRYDPQLRQEERRQAMALVANPSQIEAHAVPASAVQHMIQQNPDTSSWPVPGYEYMVITTRELAPAFKRLIALKQQKGYRAGVVCVEDIVNDPLVQSGDSCILSDDTSGFINDDSGKIRQYLKENYHYGTKYVLFGGDSVPFRYCFYSSSSIPSDFYFSNLKTKWKEISGDRGFRMTNHANSVHIFTGRIMSKNVMDVNSYSKKLLRYELNPGDGNADYIRRAYYFAADQMRENEEYNYVIPKFGDIFSLTTIDLDRIIPPYNFGSDIIDEINNTRYGFISLHAHGSPNGMKIGSKQGQLKKRCLKALINQNCVPSPADWFQEERNGLDCLQNERYPNIIYSVSCTVMPFDIYSIQSGDTIHHYNVYRNMGDSFVSGKDYGGVAFLGNTRQGYVGFSARLEGMFASEIAKGNYHVGSAEAISKILYNSNYFSLVHNLLGDPEFEMWTNVPTSFQNITITRNDNSITISELGTDNLNVTVGLNDGISQIMKSTTLGSITFSNVNPNSAIMVYKHNHLPYIAPLYLQNERIERSQYVIANDVYAGSNVDLNRAAGELTIAEGSEYEIETKGQVVLAPGFKVEKGALFSVTQSDY